MRRVLFAGMLAAIILTGAFAPLISEAHVARANSWSPEIENGNQEMLADPVRPMLYYCDPNGDTLWIRNLTDGTNTSLLVGSTPISIAESRNGSELFVSIRSANCIRVIDIETRTIARTINLSFTPWSVRQGPDDRLVVSSGNGNDDFIRMINSTTGVVVASEFFSTSAVLETSPNGSVLLAASVNVLPADVYRFALTNDSITFVDMAAFGSPGPFLNQMIVDWNLGKVYVASYQSDIVVLSLSNLTVSSTINVGDYPWSIAFSPDRSLLFVWLAVPLSDTNLLKTIDLVHGGGEGKQMTRSPGPMAASQNGSQLFLGSPDPTVLDVYGHLEPSLPRPGDTFGYAPSYVEMMFVPGLHTYAGETVTISVDGVPTNVTTQWAIIRTYRGIIASDLRDGLVFVNSSFSINGYTRWSNYTFTIDRSAQDAWRPTIYPLNAPSTVSHFPFNITTYIMCGRPLPFGSEITCAIDGSPIPTDVYEDNDWHSRNVSVMATVFTLAPGEHNATVSLSYEGHNLSVSATIIYMMPAKVIYQSPAPGAVLASIPSQISIGFDLGAPPSQITTASISLDGTPLTTVVSGSNASAGLSDEIANGAHEVALNYTSDGTAIGPIMWTFTLQVPIHMTPHDSGKGYTIMVPSGWTVTDNTTYGGKHVDTLIQGPTVDGVQSNVVVLTGTDPSIVDSQQYLSQIVQNTISALDGQGLNAVLTDGPQYLNISGYSAVTFGIDATYSGVAMHQMEALIIDATHSRFYVVTCTQSTASRAQLDATFETIINGFVITSVPPGALDLAGIGLILIVAIVIAAVAILLALLVLRNHKCPNCGEKVNREWTHCAKCGHSLAGAQVAFCAHCGAKLGSDPTNCSSCGSKIDDATKTTSRRHRTKLEQVGFVIVCLGGFIAGYEVVGVAWTSEWLAGTIVGIAIMMAGLILAAYAMKRSRASR